MINRLGWMPDQNCASDVDSECSDDSLTDTDQAELEDFLSSLSMSTNESSSDTDSDFSDTDSVVAPPYSSIRVAENEEALDVDNVESVQEESRTQILVPHHEICLYSELYGMDLSWSLTISIRIIVSLFIGWIERLL